MNEIVTHRKCNKCGAVKELSLFTAHPQGKYGVRSACKACDSERGKEHYASHRERILEKQKLYNQENRVSILEKDRKRYAENPEKQKEASRKWSDSHPGKQKSQQKAWRDTHKDHIAERTRNWAIANPEKRALTAEKRRAQKATSGGVITAKEWNDLKKKYGHRCLCCKKTGIKLTIDHVVPLSKGGAHTIENAQPLCGSCNSSKHTKTVDYRPKEDQ